MTLHCDRRSLLMGASAAPLLTLPGCMSEAEGTPSTASAATYTALLGAQLYTVRDLFERDPRSTLEALAEIGVKDCETAGLFEHNPTEIRAIMDDLNLISRSGHIRLPQLRDEFGAALEESETLGQDRLYLGWIPEEERTPDKYRALADLLNERGQDAKDAGKMVGYHNHDFELIEQSGVRGYDILLERTDPELVTMELDFFWTAQAGADPLTLFEGHPGRFSSCHVKDRSADGEMVSVGDGTIDFKNLLPIAEQAGIERFYVEHDNPAEPLVSIARGVAHLTA